MPSQMDMFVFETVITWLFFVFLATIVYFIFLRKRLRYFVIFVIVTVGVLSIASLNYFKGVHKTKSVTKQIGDAFNESSRLVVSSQAWSENPNDKKVLYQTEEKEDLQKIAGFFSLELSLKRSYCECMGDIRFDLYKENALVKSFTYHHQRHIRLKDSDFGDINLTPDSIDKLKRWQKEVGIILLEDQNR